MQPEEKTTPQQAQTTPSTVTALFRDAARLDAERRRLVAYCGRIVGDRTAAEEIAQDALSMAWSERDRLRSADAWQGWLTGIARNLCLRWRQRAAIEARRNISQDSLEAGSDSTAFVYRPDPLAEMEHNERALLLDRALSRLPRSAHSLLIERYIDDLPLSEIAARRGIREETATVQLFRGRSALKKALTSPELRSQAIETGLVTPSEASCSEWTETSLWCPECGQRRLLGIFGERNMGEPGEMQRRKLFVLRCPACGPADQPHKALVIFAGSGEGQRGGPLDGVNGFRAGFKRIAAWWHNYSETAVIKGRVPCHNCGRITPVSHDIPGDDEWSPADTGRNEPFLFTRCPVCRHHCCLNLTERAFMLPQAQKFWSENPRSKLLSSVAISTADGPAYLTRLESVTGRAALEVLTDASTLAIRSIVPASLRS